MKKFSSLLVVFMCLISLFLAGCSKADNATLISIDNKYNYIVTKQDKIFVGSRFLPEVTGSCLGPAVCVQEPRHWGFLRLPSASASWLLPTFLSTSYPLSSLLPGTLVSLSSLLHSSRRKEGTQRVLSTIYWMHEWICEGCWDRRRSDSGPARPGYRLHVASDQPPDLS